MIIFYYRDIATGEIDSIHENRQNWTAEQAAENVANFNSRGFRLTAHMAEIEPGSIWEHLYNEANKKQATAAAIENALEAIREAERALQMLEV